MNLRWANKQGQIYFPSISPKMGKHCDLAHVVDPSRRNLVGDENPRFNLTAQETSMAFDVMVTPNHKGNIVGPGEYELDITVAAENALPGENTVSISLSGTWYLDETIMFTNGIGAAIN